MRSSHTPPETTELTHSPHPQSPDLFTPLPLGSGQLVLPNRIVMAPLTRCRADRRLGGAPQPINALYYAQRASAGLIISEATQISQQAQGYPGTPGIHTPRQVAGWRAVTDAVHRAGGLIFAQLWHVGRVSHNAYQPDGGPPVSSSDVPRPGLCTLPDGRREPNPIPRPLTLDEIRSVLDDYRAAALNAQHAGFDGVELHGANGYLPDQFLRDSVNRRSDEYGGPIPNRTRFHLEAARALVEVWGPGRVGVRLSPSGVFGNLYDTTPRQTFSALVLALDDLPLAYLHIMEADNDDLTAGPSAFPDYQPIPVAFFKPLTRHPIITNAGFTFPKAQAYLARGDADAVAFGTLFIANPDLPARFQRFARALAHPPLNTPDPATFYWSGSGDPARGYTDYPTLDSEPAHP